MKSLLVLFLMITMALAIAAHHHDQTDWDGFTRWNDASNQWDVVVYDEKQKWISSLLVGAGWIIFPSLMLGSIRFIYGKLLTKKFDKISVWFGRQNGVE